MSRPGKKDELITRKYRKRSQTGQLFYTVMRNKGSLVGFVIICIILATFFSAFFISYNSMAATSAANRIQPPSWQFPFGTDNLGRNLFLRIVYGARYSVTIGFACTFLSLFFGVLIGAVSGFYGGFVDNVIMRITDVISSVPGMLFTMVIMTAFGQSLGNMIFAMGINGITMYVRITRASVLAVRSNEFVEASKAIGVSNFEIIYGEVLPNGMAPIIITVTTGIGMTIMAAAGLSFIGFGVPPPLPEWGGLVSSGRAYLRTAPWISAFPGLAIMLVTLSFNMMGDGLRTALDPKQKR